VGAWPNIQCVPISNADSADNIFGLNRSNDVTINPLQLDTPPINCNWQLSQIKGGGDARELHRAQDRHRILQEQIQDRERRWGKCWACDIERCNVTLGRLSPYPPATSTEVTGLCTEVEEGEIATIVLQAVMPPPLVAFEENQGNSPPTTVVEIRSEWGVKGVVPSHPTVDHVERIAWKAPPSRFDITYESFWGAQLGIPGSDDEYWRNIDLPDDDSDW